MMVIWKNEKCQLEKYGWAFFPNILKKGIYFQNILKKYPWRRLRRRPPGAAAPGGGGIFSKYLENRPLFSKYLEKRPIHIFLIDTFQFFQITTIYKGTQVTNNELCHNPDRRELKHRVSCIAGEVHLNASLRDVWLEVFGWRLHPPH